MRGTLHGPSQFGDISRFIPAGAGNISEGRSCLDSQTVYPRWREEHPIIFCHTPDAAGLSSLARETLQLDARMNLLTRFIPAGAGNTPAASVSAVFNSVYPRWRGEHREQPEHLREYFGLSPLARGTPRRNFHFFVSFRFIPAGAGNTFMDTGAEHPGTVYPRWRGEHDARLKYRRASRGLSPLARGTRQPDPRFPRAGRFIPAGAGNTLKIYYCFIIAF